MARLPDIRPDESADEYSERKLAEARARTTLVLCSACKEIWWERPGCVTHNKCPKCVAAYKRELRQRKKRGRVGQAACSTCGASLEGYPGNRRQCDKHTRMGQWEVFHAERIRKLEEDRREWENPTKEESWLRIAKARLSEARRLARGV